MENKNLVWVLVILVIGAGAFWFVKNTEKIKGDFPETPIINNNQVSITCTPSSPASLAVTYPNGGETFTAGEKITVTWKSCNISNSVGVTLSGFPYPSDRQFFVGSWGSATNGTQIVTIPSNVTSGKYVMNISTPPESNPGAEDWSDNSFTINSLSSTVLPQYIAGQEGWPPVITTSATTYACTPKAASGEEPKTTVQKIINGRTYCVFTTMDAAAGSRYGEYTYITANGSGTKTTNFTLKWPNCGVYGGPNDPNYIQCQSAQDAFFSGLDALIDSLM